MSKLFNNIKTEPDGLRLYAQEYTILECTCLIGQLMTIEGIELKDLAKKMRKSVRYVKNMMQGNNIKIKDISDALFVMGYEIEVSAKRSKHYIDEVKNEH